MMRTPEYLSPTALMKWEANPEEYYLQYLADNRPPRIPQTEPMAVGSAFDAYIKNYLHERVFGKYHDPRFELQTIFEAQVEPQNRDWAFKAGKYCFDQYVASGAAADLLVMLLESDANPRFEFTVQGTIGGIPLLGKPDCYFKHKKGPVIILDWKVNGFCSKYPKSPCRGYLKLRGDGAHINQMHKDCLPMNVNGVIINIQEHLETINKEWGLQLATYAWLEGAPVGSEFIVAIDQLCCSPDLPDKPKIRVAEHRCTIGKEYQETALSRYQELWTIINSNHIFRNMSITDSVERCEALDMVHLAYGNDNIDAWLTGRE